MTDLGDHLDKASVEQAQQPDSPIERALAVTGDEDDNGETNQGQSGPQPAEVDQDAAPLGTGSPRR